MSDVKRYESMFLDPKSGEMASMRHVSEHDYDALLAELEGERENAKEWLTEHYALQAERDQLRAERDNLFAERNQLESELRHRQKLIDDAWHAWDVALKGCEAMRAERDSHQRLCIAEMEKNAQLRAELEAIRGQQPVAFAAFAENGNIRIWSTNYDEVRARAIKHGWATTSLYALPPQQPDAVSVPGVHEFAVEILRGALEGGNFDGGDIQEMGVRHGLLFPEHRTERCGEYCECAEYGFPVECFRIVRALLSTKNAEEGE